MLPVEEHVVGQHGQFNNTKVDPDYAAWLVIKTCLISEGYSNIPPAVFAPPYLHRPLAAGTSCQVLELPGVVTRYGKRHSYLASAGGDGKLDNPCAGGKLMKRVAVLPDHDRDGLFKRRQACFLPFTLACNIRTPCGKSLEHRALECAPVEVEQLTRRSICFAV